MSYVVDCERLTLIPVRQRSMSGAVRAINSTDIFRSKMCFGMKVFAGFMRFDTVTTTNSLHCSLIPELVTLRDNERYTSTHRGERAIPGADRPIGQQPSAARLGIALPIAPLSG